jgi:nucleoid DNA-binding protein
MTKTAVKKTPTKNEILSNIAETTNLSKGQVSSVLSALSEEIKKSVGKKGPGQFTLPGLCKIMVKRMPATKARKGINPFTKEEQIFKAKPARNVVRIRPLKSLKEMVE